MPFTFKIAVRLAIAHAAVAAALIAGCVSDQAGDTAVPTSVSTPQAVASDTLFTEGFESGSLAWDDNFRPEAKSVIAAAARTGSRGLRITFQAGQDGGTLTKFVASGDRMYVSMAVRFPSSWAGGTELLKLRAATAASPWASFGTGGACPSGQTWALSGMNANAPNLDLAFSSYFVGMPSSSGRCTPSAVASYSAPLAISKGVWHVIEIEATLNTVGQANGWQRIWLDGVLKADWTGLTFRTSSAVQWNAVSLWMLPQGSNPSQALDLDDVMVLRQRPAPLPPPPPPAESLFADGFESGLLNAWDDRVGAPAHAVSPQAARSGSQGLRVTFTPSQSGGALSKFFSRRDRVYVRAAVRFSANWTGETELLRLRAAPLSSPWASFGVSGTCPSGTNWAASNVGLVGTSLALRFLGFFSGMQPNASGQCWGNPGVAQGATPAPVLTAPLSVPKGDWHVVEFEAQLNTVGVADGWQRLWLDGVQKGEWTGLTWRTSTALQWNAVTLDLWSSGVTQSQSLDIDDVVVQSARSGSVPVPPPAPPPPPPPPPAPAPSPVATVAVSPASVSITIGATRQLTATLRGASGELLTNRVVSWSTSNAAIATVTALGLVTATGAGTATITALSEGKSGTASIVVTAPAPPTPTSGEPIYSAANPDHKLHVYENWSNITSISQLTSVSRADGGRPWLDEGIRHYGAVVNAPDGFGSVRHLTTDYDRDKPIPPHGSGAHAAGYHWYIESGDDNAVGGGKNNRGLILGNTSYLNKPAKASVVYEWAIRYRGTSWYEGKTVDINPGYGGGVGRFNFEPFDAALGWSGNCTDVVCLSQYAGGGYTPRYSGLPPNFAYTAPNITRTQTVSGMPNVTIWYKQNAGWGTAPGTFSWGAGGHGGGAFNADTRGTNTPMWQAGWLYYKLRITKQAPGQGFGNGRIEMWIGQTPGSLIKVMDYIGDVGGKDAGLVYVDPTGTNDQLQGEVHFFGLASRRYKGGGQVDIGTVRIWSHSR